MMRKLILIALMVVFALSCQDKTRKKDDSTGSGCVTGVMVDIRDGIVHSLPEDKDWGGNGTYIESEKESNVLITVAVAQSPTGEIEEHRKYWKWNEDLKKFKFAKEEYFTEKK